MIRVRTSARRPRQRRVASRLAPLPPSRTVPVRSADGNCLHVEEFGPADAAPIVLVHGIACAIAVWHNQITDLATEHRVIVYDQRGHGRSPTPGRNGYSLGHLADDLDAVLAATIRPGERAVVAGHSMGGIAITAWADRHPDRVAERVGAVALINTTTGDLLRNVALLAVPRSLAGLRVAGARQIILRFGAAPVVGPAAPALRRFVNMMATGKDADPAVAPFIYELFAATPARSRARWARVLVENLGPEHIGLQSLIVPTLVIGSTADRIVPIGASRRIADRLPNLVAMQELPGGHCSILEFPATVNQALRGLIETSGADPDRYRSGQQQ